MTDRKKVIDGLWHCTEYGCKGCPYEHDCKMTDGFNRLAKDAAEMLVEDINVPGKWISVKDRLPEKHGHYLVVRDNGYMSVDMYSRSSHWGKDVCKITHWMPLPEPPKDGEVG